MTPEEARDLTAYAADIARRIAPEYRAEYQAAGGWWFPVPNRCSCTSGWGTKQQAERHTADWKADGYATRVVRRYVTTEEEA